MKINKVFEVISLLPNVYNDKKERNDNESASLSPQVEIAGFSLLIAKCDKIWSYICLFRGLNKIHIFSPQK